MVFKRGVLHGNVRWELGVKPGSFLHTRRRGSGSRAIRQISESSRVFLTFLLSTTSALAQPTGPVVVAGSAQVSAPSSTLTTVNQSSAKAIINWQDFSVASGGTVQFDQPNSAAITLNRVTGGNISALDGAVKANGQVWLLNPNGVMIGKDASINVGGLLATSSSIANQDFLDGNYNFSGGKGAVANNGAIRAAKGGSVVLSAPSVANNGLIEAEAGHVVLGGDDIFTVDFSGDHLLSYAVGPGSSGKAVNSGTISAAGGRVLMTARAAADLADSVVNNSGMIQATSARVENGEIILDAGNGAASNSGILNASGRNAGETGGSVQLLGKHVALTDNASIDVSGDVGGGQVLIGGNFHGAGPQANARTTTIGKAAIKADAITKGDGGKVAIWSDGDTRFNGAISARGGAQSGHGGQVETSGHTLGIGEDASVNAGAPQGAAGEWLLDPTFLDIIAGGNDTSANPGNDGGSLPNGITFGYSPNGGGNTATVTNGTINQSLFFNDVVLQANNDIRVNAPINVATAKTLELDAGHSIILKAGINVAGGKIILTANNPGGTGNAADAGIINGGGGSLSALNISLSVANATGAIGTSGSPITIGGLDVTGKAVQVALTLASKGASAFLISATDVDITSANLNIAAPPAPGNLSLDVNGVVT